MKTASLPQRILLSLSIMIIAALTLALAKPWRASGQGSNTVTTVSAASFAALVAPDSIAAAFGARLATRTEAAASQPLPTNLGGTTVMVNGAPASLFFVSPTQVNFIIPPSTVAGDAAVTIRSGDGTVSTGPLRVEAVAPAIFTANSSGQGAPAGVLLRVRPNGSQQFEELAEFNSATGTFVPRPINPGPVGERVFLVLFLCGIRGAVDPNGDGNVNETVHLLLGGSEITPSFAGKSPDFTGLDQLNAEIPRSLIGRGAVNLAVNFSTLATSNAAGVVIGGTPPPIEVRPGAAPVLAGEEITINGAGFAANADDNQVYIVDEMERAFRTKVKMASPNQLRTIVSFGAGAGRVLVRTPQGEGISATQLRMRTSISGVVEDTRRQPLAGVVVRMRGANISDTTNAEGSFILPDTPPGPVQIVEIDGSNIPGSLPFPIVMLKMRVLANRDNQLAAPVALQQINGPAITVGSGSLALEVKSSAMGLVLQSAPQAPNQTGRIGNVVFEIQPGATVVFPNGSTSGTLNLTIVEKSRTPVSLPPNVFSSVIAQITAIGVTLSPGGKLTFPNTDRLAAGSQAMLYRFDQRLNSPTLGSFIESGAAAVSADGLRIETALGAITEATLYFVAAPRLATTVVGRVVDSDGATPVRQARVRSRGQEAFTDGNGGFIMRNVLVNAGDQLSVEASFMRPDRRVDRIQSKDIAAVVNGVTQIEDLKLPSEDSNRPPVVLIPTSLSITGGEPRNLNFVAGDPDAGQRVVDVSISGASFVSRTKGSDDTYTLQLAPSVSDAGVYTLILTATDNLGASLTFEIALRVNRPPAAIVQTVTLDEDTMKTITLAGDDPSGFPLSFVIVSQPANGILSGALPNLIYRPRPNFNGSDSFTFRVNNGESTSQPAQVSIFVNPINDPPVLNAPGQQIVDKGNNVSLVITASDVDVGDVLIFSATNLPSGATLRQLNAVSAQFDWATSLIQAGSYTVTFTVRDNGVPALSDTKSVTITVTPRFAQAGALEGGLVYALLNDGANLIAGAYAGGIFLSNNNGQTWRQSDLKNINVYSLAMSGTNVFAGTQGFGVYISTNNGQNWRRSEAGLPVNPVVSSLAVSGGKIFAGIGLDTERVDLPGRGVFISTNNGQSWQPANTGIENMKVLSLAVSGTNIFAGTDGGGVFRSTNDGQTWTPVNSGLTNPRIASLAVSGVNLFAGTRGGGVFRSSNLGQNWAPANTGLPAQTILSLLVSGANIFAGADGGGVFRSTNDGQSWTAANLGITGEAVVALGLSGANLFAGTGGNGVYRSADQGQNWAPANSGLTAVSVYALIVSGTNLLGGTLFTGIFLSPDQGQSWRPANTGLPGKPYVTSFALSGANLFAGTDRGVFLSVNQGQSWTSVNVGLTSLVIRALGVSGASIFAATSDGVFRSDNQGQTWSLANTGIPAGLYFTSFAVSGASLFVGASGGGVFLSTNNGQSWTPVNSGLTNRNVEALALSGANLFAGTNGGGVFLSTNNGQSWTPVNSGLTNQSVHALVVSGANLFAGTEGGVFLSTNNGQSWTPAKTGLSNPIVLSFAVSGATLYVGTFGGGVFISQ